MMNLIYNWIINKAWSRQKTYFVFLLCSVLFFAVAGFALWSVFFRFIFDGITGAICFSAYPAVFIGFFGGILFLYRK